MSERGRGRGGERRGFTKQGWRERKARLSTEGARKGRRE